MVKRIYYSDMDIEGMIHNIMRNMIKDDYKPDYIVGISRGGLVPAVKISHYLDIRMETLKVSLSNGENESNCWMADDAFAGKKILIVDDINDTGETLQWIKKDWTSLSYPRDSTWDQVWHQSVRFAVLIDNEASSFTVDYSGYGINKKDDPQWCVFPWENWFDHSKR